MQLTLNPNHASKDDVPSEELDLFKQVYTQASQSGKAQLLRKLRMLINPEYTRVEDPKMKSTMRGRPPGKMNKSIQRKLSTFKKSTISIG